MLVFRSDEIYSSILRLSLSLSMLLLVVGAAPTNASGVTIDFESAPYNTLLTTEFESVGVHFSGVGNFSGRVLREGDFGIGNFGNSPIQVVHAGLRNEPTTISFVDPSNTANVVGTSMFRFLVGDGNPDDETFEITFRGVEGDILSGPTQYSTGGEGISVQESISTIGERIGHVEINLSPSSDSGVGFDDLVYALIPDINSCDFNSDSTCDITDLNAMLAEGPIAGGVAVTPGVNDQFDLATDGVIDNLDRDVWLAIAADHNGFASPYKLGDASLDGAVDGQDFILWNGSKFTSSLRWDDGDFNSDGAVDGQDFILWNVNKFTSSDAMLAVPEPSALAYCISLLLVRMAVVSLRQSSEMRSRMGRQVNDRL